MKKNIPALTATRAIAAILIVMFHYGKHIPPFDRYIHFFFQANIAVGYFFVLSGFVMMWTYRQKKVALKPFYIKRIARITPVYYLALVFGVLMLFHQQYLGQGLVSEHYKEIVYNTLFIQSYIPGYALTVNVPAWSLSVEMLFYLSFPLFLVFAQRRQKAFIWFVIIFFIASQVVHQIMVDKLRVGPFDNEMHELVYYNPVFHLNQFLLGMMGVYVYDLFKKADVRISSFMMLVSVFLLLHFPRDLSVHNGILAPFFLLMIVGIALREPLLLRVKPMVFLGEISYGIYILQAPLYYFVDYINTKQWHLPERSMFFLYVSILILLATLSYYLVEQPLRKKISSLA